MTVDGALITPERKAILAMELEQLLSDLKDGDLKPIEVLEAYQVSAKPTSRFDRRGKKYDSPLTPVENGKLGPPLSILTTIDTPYHFRNFRTTVIIILNNNNMIMLAYI